MPKKLVIIGLASLVAEAASLMKHLQPDREIVLVTLTWHDQFRFDASWVGDLVPADCELFVALDARAVNFSRLELFSLLKGKGFGLARLISPRASVEEQQRIGENSIIHAGATLSSSVHCGYNAVVRTGAIIESGCRIGNSVWIGPGAVIGMGAFIGDNTTIGPGVIIAQNVKIGKQCEILEPGLCRENMADKTFHAAGYDGPVRIVKF